MQGGIPLIGSRGIPSNACDRGPEIDDVRNIGGHVVVSVLFFAKALCARKSELEITGLGLLADRLDVDLDDAVVVLVAVRDEGVVFLKEWVRILSF